MTEEPTPTVQKTPMDVLQLQVSRLTEISQAQHEQIGLLKSQSEQLNQILQATAKPVDSSAFGHVKIENINMPFWALVGFLIKLSFAWIPAMLIMGAIAFLLTAVFGGILAGIFGGIFDAF